MERTDRGALLRWAAGSRGRHRAMGLALRTAAPLLPRTAPPKDPVFILGSPRSGTTMLFQLLDRSPHLASLGKGSQFLWEMFHHAEGEDFESHRVGPEDVTSKERKVLYSVICRLTGGMRYLDKFPRNCLRAEYLHALFPGAYFVHIVRDGRAVASSLITGWQTEAKFGRGTRLPMALDIAGYDGANWRFLVPPGWEDYVRGRTLADVCAFQWTGANEAILQAKERIATERWVQVKYEDILDSPRETTAELLSALDLPPDEQVMSWAMNLDRHVTRTAVTAPRVDKWRDEHPSEIVSVLPALEPMLRRLGYETDRTASG